MGPIRPVWGQMLVSVTDTWAIICRQGADMQPLLPPSLLGLPSLETLHLAEPVVALRAFTQAPQVLRNCINLVVPLEKRKLFVLSIC